MAHSGPIPVHLYFLFVFLTVSRHFQTVDLLLQANTVSRCFQFLCYICADVFSICDAESSLAETTSYQHVQKCKHFDAKCIKKIFRATALQDPAMGRLYGVSTQFSRNSRISPSSHFVILVFKYAIIAERRWLCQERCNSIRNSSDEQTRRQSTRR